MPKMRRNGVMATVTLKKINVSIPVVRVANSTGFAPTLPRYKSNKSKTRGTSALTKIRNLGNVNIF